jgi:hypothetical protein
MQCPSNTFALPTRSTSQARNTKNQVPIVGKHGQPGVYINSKGELADLSAEDILELASVANMNSFPVWGTESGKSGWYQNAGEEAELTFAHFTVDKSVSAVDWIVLRGSRD